MENIGIEIRNQALRDAVKVCEELKDAFGDERFAIGQPVSGIKYQHACDSCIKAIGELILPEPATEEMNKKINALHEKRARLYRAMAKCDKELEILADAKYDAQEYE